MGDNAVTCRKGLAGFWFAQVSCATPGLGMNGSTLAMWVKRHSLRTKMNVEERMYQSGIPWGNEPSLFGLFYHTCSYSVLDTAAVLSKVK